MTYFGRGSNDAEKFVWSPTIDEPIASPLSPLSEVTSRSTQSKRKYQHVHRPWRHSVSHHILHSSQPPTSTTVRQFRPERQRKRLFVASFIQWLGTAVFCILLGLCLWGFAQFKLMKVWQIKTFNALMVLGSMWLGTNLTSSLREYSLMMRWRLLAMKFRPLKEADLLMHCESLRKVFKLLFAARPTSGWGLTTTQIGCLIWIAINLALAVLVALLGLTYNLETAKFPELRYGLVSVANLTYIRDVWGSDDPSHSAQLGAANGFGIQGQDYNFTDGPVPGQSGISVFGSPMTPNIYATAPDWSVMTYYFMDLNPDNSNLSVLTKRHISVTASCTEYPIVRSPADNSIPNGTVSTVTYLDPATNETRTLNTVRVGPGAMTYISALNSTCGPRCTEIFALQSAGTPDIPDPSFYHCTNTISRVTGTSPYVQSNQTEDLYQLADAQAAIMAGAIGWTGFNFTADDLYQYVRYPTESWWSPNTPTNTSEMAGHIMEFAIEAIAALDNNGPRVDVAGWYPVPSQVVSVNWRWAGTLLGVIPLLHFVAMVICILWANEAIIRDESCVSVARLWRPVVEKLGGHGCLLTGEEICDVLGDFKVKYGVVGGGTGGVEGEGREGEVERGLRFENDITHGGIKHVGIIEEGVEGVDAAHAGEVGVEGVGRRKRRRHVNFPAGLYDGEGWLGEEEVKGRSYSSARLVERREGVRKRLLRVRMPRRSEKR